MKELFGIPTTTIAIIAVVLLSAVILATLAIAVSNRTMFRMGVRNILRRRTQSVLVVVGLMLGTMITTAAFVTGDTIDHSLTKGTFDLVQRSDLDITWNGQRDFTSDAGATTAGQPTYLDASVVDALEREFAGDTEIEGFLPTLYVLAAAQNVQSGHAAPALQLAGYDPERLGRLGGLRLLDGSAADLALADDAVLLSERAATDLHASAGDIVSLFVGAGAHEFRVAGIVRDELASGILGIEYSSVPGGVAMPLSTLRALAGFEHNEINALTVALKGSVRSTVGLSAGPQVRIEAFLAGAGSEAFAAAGLSGGQQPVVDPIKDRLVEDSEATGNLFVTLFLVLGLFSMAAGVLLIFMILVMLAAERRAEMGMARAVGAHRKHLLMSFVSEGMVYSLFAGAAGVALGVLASLGLTNVLLPAFGGDYFSIIEAKVTWQAVVIGYGLGVVVTFITVVLAALKVTNVNIVAAIRDLPSMPARVRRTTRWLWVAVGVPALVVPPVGLWLILRKGFGTRWAWVLAPLGVLAGGALLLLGHSSENPFFFGLGASLAPLSIGAMASRLGAQARLTWTAVGLLLLTYWALPPAQHEQLFGAFESGMEMFVLSGLMIAVGATLVISFNAGVLTSIFSSAADERGGARVPSLVLALAAATAGAGWALGDSAQGLGQICYMVALILAVVAACGFAVARFSQVAPALKMAIAYPAANRFRFGMTVAMFSLIIFSLTVFSILIANFGTLDGGPDARGNLDVITTRTGGSAVGDVVADLARRDPEAAKLVEGSGQVSLYQFGQQARNDESGDWLAYPVLAADGRFLSGENGGLAPSLDSRATGYTTDAAVLAAVRNDSQLALIDRYAAGQGFSDYDFETTVTIEDDSFAPFPLQVRNATTGKTMTVTVIGILNTRLASTTVSGVYVNEEAYTGLFGAPDYQRQYLRLSGDDGAREREVADAIEAALATRGVGAESVSKLLDDQLAQDIALNRMFQAFMALGLIVGVAGLGVIAFRSVVERRQQIGMLRAIGFQRGTMGLTFLVESGFIAVMGILSGVVGGVVLARNLLTSEQFTEGGTVNFAIPWGEVAGLVVAALVVSLVMTWWPSRQASRVPVAEALRYE